MTADANSSFGRQAPPHRTPLFIVDAFTTSPYGGNPAAVCLLETEHDASRDTDWMQAVAAEMNLSETAFVAPTPQRGTFGLRWFTPMTEVDLCGHATLASAFVLYDRGKLDLHTPVRFDTKSGALLARPHPRGFGQGITLDFPADPPAEATPPDALLAGLRGLSPRWVGRGHSDWLIELADAAAVTATTPDFLSLRQVEGRGFIITAPGDGEIDFVSRCFYPALGIDEDPVTGSAHCTLTPYWSAKLGKTAMYARQLSRRGGEVRVTLEGDRVHLTGQAVMTIRGELLI